MIDDLAAFYAARLDEAEEQLRESATYLGVGCSLPGLHLDAGPARRDIAAKRAILAEYEAMDDEGLYHGLSHAIAQLAGAWSDHPDYRREWES